MLNGDPRAVVGVRPEMAVRGQCGVRRGVPEGPLPGDDVAAGDDQTGGVEVPQLVAAATLSNPLPRAALRPLVANGVLVGRSAVQRAEQPAVGVVVR